ncbi:Phytochrome C [Platanthera guangdongensis]|uniref:Phytochrome C n=1 Tax=Platanthera guangdongensis TaxID=2320717 RepID=A0ABR2MCF0_9ASPA
MSSKSNKASCSRSSSALSKHSARVFAQTSLDAKLNAEFEDSGRATSMGATIEGTGSPSSSSVSAYLQRMQRGQCIQPFGCLVAVNIQTFEIFAYTENAPEMLDVTPHAVPNIGQEESLTVGTDVRSLFRSPSSIALQKAAVFGDVNLLNPILVHCRNSGKPFYAILHRIDEGLVIDLEPVNPADVPVTAAGALKSYKLAAKAISRLQTLPRGNITLLCDVLVREVRELTGFDRVMAYKFHEDEHGEVIAECRRSDIESYLGLHFPATDIPQASRFLFMKNKVRMICDCSSHPVKVIQGHRLAQPISLCGSTMRAPHGCHAQYMANMGSIASLVLSITINDDDDDDGKQDSDEQPKGRKLWGLVVCHHISPRFVPFPLRYACEFLLQVFSVQLNKEVELAAQMKEKHILQTQTVLCDMILRDSPISIFTQSPNVMDLVKCEGAALYYRKQFYLLGITPTESQIKDLIVWLQEHHSGSTGLSTDSLTEAGYPGAESLGNAICGMAATKITSKDYIFWFRPHTAKEIKWGGAKDEPVDKKDDGQKMHPRASFKAFLEVVKFRSLPWEDVEMDAIHSLQLILRGSLHDEAADGVESKSIVRREASDEKSFQGADQLRTVTNEMVRLIETATVPILAVDDSGNLNGWNSKAAELTGLSIEEAIGMPLMSLVEDESLDVARNVLAQALQDNEEQNVEIKFKTFGLRQKHGPVVLVINACCSHDMNDNVVGVCFVGQDMTEHKLVMDKYTRIQGDYTAIIRNPSALIPPIFMIDEHGRCTEWNSAMQEVSGLKRGNVIDKMIVGEVFTLQSSGCRVKDHATLTKLKILLNGVMSGEGGEKLLFGFYDVKGKCVESLLSAAKKEDVEGKVTGVLCFLYVGSPELQHALQVQKMSEQAALSSSNELAHLRQQIRNPLKGIVFTHKLMEGSELSEDQKQLIRTSALCQEQLAKILDDMDLESIEQCWVASYCCQAFEIDMLHGLPGFVLEAMELRTWAKSLAFCYISHSFKTINLDGPLSISSTALYP